MASESLSGGWPAVPRRRSVPVELLLILSGAAAVLLLPRLFGDPQGVDPNGWRLSAYFLAVWVATLSLRGLRPLVPLAFSLFCLALPTSVWLWLLGYAGPAPAAIGPADSVARNAFAGVMELAVAAIMALGFWWMSGRPNLRVVAWPGRSAWALAAAGTALFLLVSFGLPANLLGRQGVPLLALSGSAGAALGVANAASALAQEVQFRAVLLVALERHFGPLWALGIQAVVFGVGHLAIQYQGPAASFIPIAIGLGLVWGWATQRSRSLLPAAVMHVAADFFVLAAVVSGLYGG